MPLCLPLIHSEISGYEFAFSLGCSLILCFLVLISHKKELGDKVLRLFALKILRKESVFHGLEGTEYVASDSSVIHGGVVPEFLKINIL